MTVNTILLFNCVGEQLMEFKVTSQFVMGYPVCMVLYNWWTSVCLEQTYSPCAEPMHCVSSYEAPTKFMKLLRSLTKLLCSLTTLLWSLTKFRRGSSKDIRATGQRRLPILATTLVSMYWTGASKVNSIYLCEGRMRLMWSDHEV